MDWRLNSAKPAAIGELKAHLAEQAAEFIRIACAPPQQDLSGGLLAPKFIEDPAAAEMRPEVSAALDALMSIAADLETKKPGAKYLATFSAATTADGTRRVNLSIEEAPPPPQADPTTEQPVLDQPRAEPNPIAPARINQ